MARNGSKRIDVETLTHKDAKRTNIPTAERRNSAAWRNPIRACAPRKYLPDFIVQVDDGHPDPLNLVVEVKGYRGEDAKEKANTMRAYWVPGVNNLGKFGRWAFAEFTSVYEIEAAFGALIDALAAGEAA